MVKQIKGFPNYTISSTGQVWNVLRDKPVVPSISPNGYLYVAVSRKNVQKRFLLRRLVAEHFVPGRTRKNNQVRQINGRQTDCRAKNLEWTTHQATCELGKTGSHRGARGEDNRNSRLSQRQVDEIRRLAARKNKPSNTEIARNYGVSATTIGNIINGKTW